MTAFPRIVLVTGTDTDVGKTITTAALAAALLSRGCSVAAYKPAQAGTYRGDGDIDVIRRLAGLDAVHEGIRLPEPMAPVASAARAGVTLPTVQQHVDKIHHLAERYDHVLIEGSGGLLVQLGNDRHTLADIATANTPPAAAVEVCRSGLGTLNHTELTVEALTRRDIHVAGILIGSWPQQPTDVDLSNRQYLSRGTPPLMGAIPEQAAQLPPTRFRQQAPCWLLQDGACPPQSGTP
jgi:dethiobiotin synthase